MNYDPLQHHLFMKQLNERERGGGEYVRAQILEVYDTCDTFFAVL